MRVAHLWLGALLALVALAFGLVRGPQVQAHAFLVSSDPAAGQVLLQPPGSMVLRYTEGVDPHLSTFVVYNSDRDPVSGPAQISGNTVTVPLLDTATGTFTLRWHVISADDGHSTAGAVLYTVWRGGPLPAGAGQAAATTPGGIQGGLTGSAARLAAFALTFCVLGALFVAWALGWRPPVRALGWTLAGFVLAQALAFVAQGTAAVGAALGPFLRGGYLLPALDTTFGHLALLRTAGGAAAIAGLWAAGPGRRNARTSAGRVVAGLGAAAVIAGYALASHAAASPLHWTGALVDGLHLAAVSGWGGGLFWLLASGPRLPALVRAFSAWALGLMVAIVLSGAANALFVLHTVAALADTLYGRVLDIKLALFLLLVGTAACSLAAVRRAPRPRPVPGARRPMLFEGGIGLAVLVAAAVLVGTPPAVIGPVASRYFQESRPLGPGSVQLTVSPGVAGSNALSVRLTGSSASLGGVAVSVRNLDMDMGLSTLALTGRGGGLFSAQTGALSMAGTWQVGVTAGGRTARFVVTVSPPGATSGCDYGFDADLQAQVAPWRAAVQDVATDPHNPALVLAATAHGVRFSRDGGGTWQFQSLGGATGLAAVAMDATGRWYAAGAAGLWRSDDQGQSWVAATAPGSAIASLVAPAWADGGVFAATASGIAFSADGGQSWSARSGAAALQSVSRLAADPQTSGRLYAGALDGILVSGDGGRSWTPVAPGAKLAFGFAFDPSHPGTVWAAAMAQGVWVSRDGGLTWTESDAGQTNPGGMAVAVWAHGRDLLAGTMGGGLSGSEDYGATWATAGCPAAIVSALALGNGPAGPIVWLAGEDGLVRLAPPSDQG